MYRGLGNVSLIHSIDSKIVLNLSAQRYKNHLLNCKKNNSLNLEKRNLAPCIMKKVVSRILVEFVFINSTLNSSPYKVNH